MPIGRKTGLGDIFGALAGAGATGIRARQEEEQRLKAERIADLLMLQTPGGGTAATTRGGVLQALGGGQQAPLQQIVPGVQKPEKEKPAKFKTFTGTRGGKPAVETIRIDKEGVVEFSEGFKPTEKEPPRPRDEEVFTKEEAMGHAVRLIRNRLPGIEMSPGEKALLGIDLEAIYGRKFSDEEIDIWLKGAEEEEEVGEPTNRASYFKNIFDKIFGKKPEVEAKTITETGLKTISTQAEYEALSPGSEYIDAQTGKKSRKPKS